MSKAPDIGTEEAGSGEVFRERNFCAVCRRQAFSAAGDLRQLLNRFEALGADTLIKNSRTMRIGCVGRFFIKRYNNRGFLYALKRLFRPWRPGRCLRAARRLEKLEIPTPEVFAAARTFRFGRLPDCDYLVTAALPPEHRDLARVAEALPELNRTMIRDLARFAARLHDGGFEHGDLKAHNLYLLPAGPDEAARFGLIDLDAARLRPEPLGRRRRRRELARLISSILRCRRRDLGGRPDFAAAAAPFAAEYLKASGIDLYDEKLLRRVDYLYGRTRKK